MLSPWRVYVQSPIIACTRASVARKKRGIANATYYARSLVYHRVAEIIKKAAAPGNKAPPEKNEAPAVLSAGCTRIARCAASSDDCHPEINSQNVIKQAVETITICSTEYAEHSACDKQRFAEFKSSKSARGVFFSWAAHNLIVQFHVSL
jgi:hypothetical protein